MADDRQSTVYLTPPQRASIDARIGAEGHAGTAPLEQRIVSLSLI
jgi:hypothetical protein